MRRAVEVAVGVALVIAVAGANADPIDDRIAELGAGDNYKLRLASAIALAKSTDRRALRALAKVLADAPERSLRRVAVLGLAKQLPRASAELRQELMPALERAASKDRDARLRSSAASAVRAIKKAMTKDPPAPRAPRPPPAAGVVVANAPKVFVNIDRATDQSTKLNASGLARLTAQVKRSVSRMGYATAWPGNLPTAGDLHTNQARAYLIVPTVKKLEVKRQTARTAEIACTVSIRVAPWLGVDGQELWEAERAASASGSAKAQTGSSEGEVASGMRDCVEAVAEEISTRQVLPFLQRLVGS
ncbi:MAG: HEAT repeat domain-containing protein [Kofleriaceae bacterium]